MENEHVGNKSGWVGYYLSGFVSALMVVGLVGGMWWYFRPSQGEEKLSTITNPSAEDKQRLMEQTQEDTLLPSPTPSPMPIPSAEVKNALMSAVMEKQYELMPEYMLDQVEVTIPAKDCCGVIGKDQAVAQMAYLANALKPWTFDNTNPKIAAIRSKLSDITRPIIGISANNYAVVFGLDEGNRVEEIRLSLEYGGVSY